MHCTLRFCDAQVVEEIMALLRLEPIGLKHSEVGENNMTEKTRTALMMGGHQGRLGFWTKPNLRMSRSKLLRDRP